MNSGNREGEGHDTVRGESGLGRQQESGRAVQHGGGASQGQMAQYGSGSDGDHARHAGNGQGGEGAQRDGAGNSGSRDAQGGGSRDMSMPSHDVRRTLRVLVTELGLDDEQTLVVARVLDQLRCQHAESEIEQWRSNGALSDALAAGKLDRAALDASHATVIRATERMCEIRAAAAEQLFAALDAEQRKKLAYAIRMRLIAL